MNDYNRYLLGAPIKVRVRDYMVTLTIQEAAQRLGVSEVTIRRRLRAGQLSGYQEDPPAGRWYVNVPDDEPAQETTAEDADPEPVALSHAFKELVDVLKEEVSAMRRQLDVREREVRELHVILQQQALALPAPGDSRPWWRKLWERGDK